MKILSTLKTLPLLGIMASSIMLFPGQVYADNNHHMRHNDTKHERKASQNKHAYHNRHVHKEQYKHNKHKHHKHKQHREAHSHDWKVRRNNRHHGHNAYVNRYSRDYGNRHLVQHYLPTGRLRFMLGLHSDNYDIYIRD